MLRMMSKRYILPHARVLFLVAGVATVGVAIGYACDHRPMSLRECERVRGGDYQDYAGKGYCEGQGEQWQCNHPGISCVGGDQFCQERGEAGVGQYCHDQYHYYNPTRCVPNTYATRKCDNNDNFYVPCYDLWECRCFESMGGYYCEVGSEPGQTPVKACRYTQ